MDRGQEWTVLFRVRADLLPSYPVLFGLALRSNCHPIPDVAHLIRDPILLGPIEGEHSISHGLIAKGGSGQGMERGYVAVESLFAELRTEVTNTARLPFEGVGRRSDD